MKKLLVLLAAVMIVNLLGGCSLLLGGNTGGSGGSESEPSTSLPESIEPDAGGNLAKVYGEWVTEQGTLLIFREDGTNGYYKDTDDREDNFYAGTRMEILTGLQALDDLGIDEEELIRVEMYQDESTVFSIRQYVEVFVQDGIDRSDEVTEEDYHWFMFKLLSDDEAIAVLVTTSTVLELKKIV